MNCRLKDVEQLARQRFAEITAEDWGRICDHTDKIVNQYLQKEHLFDKISDEMSFVVNIGDSDDEWSSSDEEEEPSTTEIEGVEPL
ncbi:hypothetical protein Zmor_010322 [Zophobas morio]|uniref:Uncharacterized protein n=1 Tax=Zophobas morio TaxID=2755281 RepID=A0AA38IK38_9CUCU|nr:hypothetical protein Zmor_010322 [Zophobas morio]